MFRTRVTKMINKTPEERSLYVCCWANKANKTRRKLQKSSGFCSAQEVENLVC